MAQSLNTTCEEESMLFEAQAEVQTLRTELYATRRAAYEAKAGRLAAEEKCTILQEKVDVMAASLKQLEKQKEHEVEEALAKGRSEGTQVAMDRIEQAEAAHAEGERTLASAMARTAEAETRADLAEKMCGEARTGAATANAEKTAIGGERAAWHRSNDELAARLRFAEKRTQEAEEEQVRAEEEAAAAVAECHALRERSEDAFAGHHISDSHTHLPQDNPSPASQAAEQAALKDLAEAQARWKDERAALQTELKSAKE
eukprot:CAMPEP_0198205892 /NCGR_PEP_ID=MMETSP1445-20131203/9432_1 /TAXON_ID=36898 /ORGANISM="Pyramimonas sp., Strain CCMP2087" /LENGTH=258 /DNA_ID=CAMNT_0043878377 /DNA_START=238 /DNA_END=1011 /DNA_ORIENTATION=+